jgi:hypothetical protein
LPPMWWSSPHSSNSVGVLGPALDRTISSFDAQMNALTARVNLTKVNSLYASDKVYCINRQTSQMTGIR